jgi:hypothetical protein
LMLGIMVRVSFLREKLVDVCEEVADLMLMFRQALRCCSR